MAITFRAYLYLGGDGSEEEFGLGKGRWCSCARGALVIGLKHADTPWEWLITIIAIAASFSVMISASKTLPVGTVYSVFAGLGSAGTVLADSLFFGEPFKLMKLILVLLLLTGVIGLKMVTPDITVKEVL